MEFLLRHIDTAVAGFLAILLFLYSVQKRSSRLRRNDSRISPPEAAGRWPIIGHLHLLGGSQLPHITLANLADKYGPIFTIHIGVHPTLVISSWESAKECFTTHDLAVSTRPKLISSEILGWNYASFGFAPYGPYWREIRKITTSELLSNKRLEKLRHVRESEVESFVKNLYKLWTKRETGSDRVMVEMGKRIGDVNLNVALRVVARKRYFDDDSRDEKEARRCKEAMREFFRLTGLFLVGDAIPFLRWLDLGGYEKAMKKTHDELESIVEEWLEEHRQRRGSGNFGGEKDFMDVMLSKLEESTDLSGYDADIVNKATCMNIISGGTDTTAVTLTWALSLLLNNKSVLQKVQEELDLHVGKERPVKESDISNLVYLQAVVKETLRLYPAGPLSGIREFSEDCTIGGYHVPKGTRLITNLWKIQTDPKTWSDDPLEFKPDRFLTTHKDVDVKGKHFELIPFGAGRRSCPGMTYGLQMTHLVIACLLQAFDVFTDGPVDMTAIFGLTNAKATPLEVLVKPRLSISLYE
ncbi:Cytochrome P450 82A4 [Morus notabilis]|uniref:Cytochrome P450 82A4 n=2 Tax=Morus notabilis TaxID=981085 RepID=W9S173_9ROSA|nr:Cytochrome P450 82A4 [Morus notabilis]